MNHHRQVESSRWATAIVLSLLLNVWLGLLGATTAFAQGTAWSRSMGGTENDAGNGIAVDSAGNSHLTGFFRGTVDFGGQQLTSQGGVDGYVVKYDPAGNLIWARQIGGADSEDGYAIAVDGVGNVYVTGTISSSVVTLAPPCAALASPNGYGVAYVVVYDKNGACQKTMTVGSGTENVIGTGIAVDAARNVYVLANFQGTVSFPGGVSRTATGNADILVAKFLSDGSFAWATSAGGTSGSSAYGYGIAADSAGNSYLTGQYFGSIDFVGAPNQPLNSLGGTNSSNIFVAKLNGGGSPVWAKSAGDGTGNVPGGIAADDLGNSYVAGTFGMSGTKSVFLVKYASSDGTPVWAQGVVGGFVDGVGVATDGSRNVYVTGFWAQHSADFGPDLNGNVVAFPKPTFGNYAIAKYDSNGILQWANVADLPDGYTAIGGIGVDGVQNSYVIGDYLGRMTFPGQPTLTSAGGIDVFRAKVSGPSKQPQSISFGPIPDMMLGDPAFSVGATATSGLPVSFSASGPCSLTGSSVTITGVGVCTITATQAGDATYFAATPVPQSFTIRATSATTLTASPNIISFGLTVTFTAQVTSAAGVPVGQVALSDMGFPIAGATANLDASGKATILVSSLGYGSRPITATYSPAVGQFIPPSTSAPPLDIRVFGQSGVDESSGTAVRAIARYTKSTGEAVPDDDHIDGFFATAASTSASAGLGGGSGARALLPPGDPQVGASSLASRGCNYYYCNATAGARAIGYARWYNGTAGVRTRYATAVLDGVFFSQLTGHVTAAVYAFDADKFLAALDASGELMPQFLLGHDKLDDYATANEAAYSLARTSLFPAGTLLASTFKFYDIRNADASGNLNTTLSTSDILVDPGKSVIFVFDLAVYSPSGAAVNFQATLKPAPVFLTDASGNPAPLTPVGPWVPLPPAATSIVLSPATATNPVTTPVTITATAKAASGVPVPNTTVDLAITSGPNAQALAPAVTDANGKVTFTYSGGTDAGTDQIVAKIGTLQSNVVQVTWTVPGPLDHIALSPASATITVGASQSYAAQALDAFDHAIGNVTGSTTFSISPEGTCAGANCTASVAGPHTVTGVYNGKSATATLDVTPSTAKFVFKGFFAPIDMPTANVPVWNSVKAGQAVPVKWLLTQNGAPVSDPKSFSGLWSSPIACSSVSGPIEGAINEAAAGNSGLQYKGNGNWQHNWKTQASYKDSCRTVVAKFSDGTTSPVAYFQFK